MTAYPTVIFDLGNVLIRWDPRNLYRKLFGGDDAAMERFLADVCTPAWNEAQDAGRPFKDAIALASQAHPAFAPQIRAYFERWPEMLNGAIADNVEVLRELKESGRPVYALSNWSTETFPVARRQFAFLAWFNGIVLSGEERLIKPDPAFYRILLERYQLAAKDCVFVDDSLKNVEAARALGMATVHYVPGMRLRDELVRLGVFSS